MLEAIRKKIRVNRKRLEMAEARKDYEKCIETRGRILELELLLNEVASQRGAHRRSVAESR